jgi:hypothetical protein
MSTIITVISPVLDALGRVPFISARCRKAPCWSASFWA